MFKNIGEKVVVGVLTAVTLAAIYTSWEAVRKMSGSFLIPKNAVVAFSSECPAEGWRPFVEANGRFMIGAGKPTHEKHRYWQQTQPDGNLSQPIVLQQYPLHRSGGEETHLLSRDEMPQHNHVIPYGGADIAVSRPPPGGNIGVRETIKKDDATSSQGGSLPHNNIPPYYALNFCVKQ